MRIDVHETPIGLERKLGQQRPDDTPGWAYPMAVLLFGVFAILCALADGRTAGLTP